MSDRVRRRNAPANISLHIERVVLEGGSFTCAQLGQVQSSMERELTSLLRAEGLPAHSLTERATHGQLSGQLLGQNPAQLGRAMARGVYDSLKRDQNPAWDARP